MEFPCRKLTIEEYSEFLKGVMRYEGPELDWMPDTVIMCTLHKGTDMMMWNLPEYWRKIK